MPITIIALNLKNTETNHTLRYSSVIIILLLVLLPFILIIRGCETNYSGLPPHIEQIESLIVLHDDKNLPYTYHFEREMVFEDSLLLDQINDLLVDDNNRVYIAGESWAKRQVHIFHANGSYSDSLGRLGDGFGEFQSIDRLQMLDDELYLFDDELNRISKYHLLEQAWTDTIGFDSSRLTFPDHLNPDNYQASPAAVFDDGSHFVALRQLRNPAYENEGQIRYFRAGKNGHIGPDQIFGIQDVRYLVGDYAGKPAPFTLTIPERPLFDMAGSNNLYFAHSNEFFIQVLNPEGEILKAYYYPFERQILDPDEVIHPRFSHNDQLLRIRESAVYPTRWPALYSMLVDDENRIWISTITHNRDILEWWVIDDESGMLLTRFTWPFNRPVYYVKNGSVYAIEENSMGFKVAVKYSLTEISNNENETEFISDSPPAESRLSGAN